MRRDLQEQVARFEDERNCSICMDHPVDCVFVPCGHACTCSSCSSKMAECPICRQKHKSVLRIMFN
jgi:hypothetical protein